MCVSAGCGRSRCVCECKCGCVCGCVCVCVCVCERECVSVCVLTRPARLAKHTPHPALEEVRFLHEVSEQAH